MATGDLTVQVPLSRGLFALIDEADADLILPFKWYASRPRQALHTSYAARTKTVAGKPRIFYLHRTLLGLTDRRIHVDHANRDGLDNRRVNLRIATPSQNHANMAKQLTIGGRPSSSIYKGVTWGKGSGQWLAQIMFRGQRKHLGCFANELDAAAAYNAAAVATFGQFARTNKDTP